MVCESSDGCFQIPCHFHFSRATLQRIKPGTSVVPCMSQVRRCWFEHFIFNNKLCGRARGTMKNLKGTCFQSISLTAITFNKRFQKLEHICTIYSTLWETWHMEWYSGLWTQHYHCSGLSHCSGMGSVLGTGISTCYGHGQKKKKKKTCYNPKLSSCQWRNWGCPRNVPLFCPNYFLSQMVLLAEVQQDAFRFYARCFTRGGVQIAALRSVNYHCPCSSWWTRQGQKTTSHCI